MSLCAWRERQRYYRAVWRRWGISRYVEKTFSAFPRHPTAGTSPDAWRKLNSHTNGILTSGDISAYAEKTVRPYSDEPNNRDISRCVEKTSVPCTMVRAPLEHLHAHGENKDIRPWLTKPTGRPPRMRRNYCFGYVV